jgi:hypothetical protein
MRLSVLAGIVAAAATAAAVSAWAGSATAAASASANHARADQDAHALLARAVLPAGAARLAQAPAGANLIANDLPHVATPDLSDAHAYWRVAGTPGAVLAYVGAHTAHIGPAEPGSAGGPGGGYSWVQLALRPVAGVFDERSLVIKVVGLRDGATAVRVDAQVVWVIPRPSSERVPAAVREIDVTRAPPRKPATASVTVTSPATITKIVSLINALPTVQPYVMSCPSWPSDTPVVTLTFRASRAGRVLAQASELATATEPTTGCDAMSLTLRGKPQTPLLKGAAALHAITKRLGVQRSLAP